MRLAIAAVSLLALAACQDQAGTASGGSRDQIRAVGSSTVYPFAQEAVQLFQQSNPGMKAPIIESTGTGGGMKLFCAGVGAQHPDIADASRRMKRSEFEQCQGNGVTEITEVQIGVDGLALAVSQEGPAFSLSPKLVYEALAANPYGKGENTAKNWADIDPSLPAADIQVFGPPATSGTRDSLAELILEVGCNSDPDMKALKDSNEDEYKRICTQVREDGAYVDAGENDNLIVQKLSANPNAVGVFGFSYLDANRDTLKGVSLNGVDATYDTVASGEYPGARPLYIYVKNAHLNIISGLREFVQTFAQNWGPDGALTKRGMVAASEEVRAANTAATTNFTPLTGDVLN